MPKIYNKFIPVVKLGDKTNTDGVITTIKNGFFDIMPDAYGNYKVYKRSGLEPVEKFDYSVDAIYYFEKTQEYIFISGGNIYVSRTIEGNKKVIWSGLPLGGKYSFVDAGARLCIAYGGELLVYNGEYIEPTGYQEYSRVSSVVYLDGRIITNDLRDGYKQFIRVSEIIDDFGIKYDGIFFEERTKFDDIVALCVYNRLLFVFGKSSVTVWAHEGMGVFVRIDAYTLDTGINSISSVVCDDTFVCFVTNDNRLILFTDNGYKNISHGYVDRIIDMLDLKNCDLYTIKTNYGVFLIISNISNNLSYYYSFSAKNFGRLTSDIYDNMFIGGCSYYKGGKTIVGTRNGYLCILGGYNGNVYTDIGSNYIFEVETGHITHGTFTDKMSRKTTFPYYIYTPSYAVNTPVINISYNTNNRGYNKSHLFKITNKTGHFGKIVIAPNGIYNTRQVRIQNSDNCYLELFGFEEYIEVLS